jgi:hypothetical protein
MAATPSRIAPSTNNVPMLHHILPSIVLMQKPAAPCIRRIRRRIAARRTSLLPRAAELMRTEPSIPHSPTSPHDQDPESLGPSELPRRRPFSRCDRGGYAKVANIASTDDRAFTSQLFLFAQSVLQAG